MKIAPAKRGRFSFSLTYFRNDSFERFRLILRKVCKNFSIKQDIFLFQEIDEGAVGEVVLSDEGVDFHIPEHAKIILLVFAMGKGMHASMSEGFIGLSFFCRAAKAKTFRLAQNISAGF